MSKNVMTVPIQDFKDVVATVAKYVKGLRVGNIANLTQPFHKDTVMYGFTNGELLSGQIKNLYEFVAENGTAQKSRLDSTYLRYMQTFTCSTISTALGKSSPRFIKCMESKCSQAKNTKY